MTEEIKTEIRESIIHWAISVECARIIREAGFGFSILEDIPAHRAALPIPHECKLENAIALIYANPPFFCFVIILEKSCVIITKNGVDVVKRIYIDNPSLFTEIQDFVDHFSRGALK